MRSIGFTVSGPFSNTHPDDLAAFTTPESRGSFQTTSKAGPVTDRKKSRVSILLRSSDVAVSIDSLVNLPAKMDFRK